MTVAAGERCGRRCVALYDVCVSMLAERSDVVYTPGERGGRQVHARSIGGPLAAGILGVAALGIAFGAGAQESTGPFGGFKHDKSAPIEITSDALEVHQAKHLAVFTGDVVAGQGTLRLTADRVEVSYAGQDQAPGTDQAAGSEAESDPATGVIREMTAKGDVFISNGSETAQGEQARYDVASGTITMTGNVVLTQGENVISGQRLSIDLDQGTGRVEGRVKSIFTPQDSGAQQSGGQEPASQ